MIDQSGRRLFATSKGWPIEVPRRSKKRTDSEVLYNAKQPVLRLASIVQTIIEVAEQFDVKRVYVENYAFSMNSSSVTKLAEIGGAVKTALFLQRGLVAIPVSVMTVRSVVLGKGYGKIKKDALVKVVQGLGFTFDNDDIMDAFMICMYGLISFQEVIDG